MSAQVKAKPRVGTDLTEGSIMKTLIVFAIPMILANLVQQLYNTVDLIVIGKFAGQELKLDGEEYTIVRQGDILAIVE